MAPKYEIGQKVTIKTADSQQLSPRGCAIDAYAGQVGEVTDYYSISPYNVEVFYIYLVRVGASYKEVALHEDEIEAYIE